MARRIVLTMLALIGALLVSTVVPLGLITTGHERASFKEDTVFSAGGVASFAEGTLADHGSGSSLARALARARRAGEQVRVYDIRGRVAAGNGGDGMAVPTATLGRVLGGGDTVATGIGDRLRVVVPVRNDDGVGIVGAVVLARPTTRLDQRLRTLWLWLAAVAHGTPGRDGDRDRAGPLGGTAAERTRRHGTAAGWWRPGCPVGDWARASGGAPPGASLQRDGRPPGDAGSWQPGGHG